MNPNELRIGNYVFKDGHFKSVSIVECASDIGMAEYFEPIALTEKWLTDFGFDNKGTNAFDIDLKNISIRVMNNRIIVFTGSEYQMKISMDYDSCELPNKIEYIHQLQNLYFALTGEELEIKA